MKTVDIANEIYLDSGAPTDTSIPAIAFWIRGKIGTLNVLLFENLSIDINTQELTNCGGSLPYEIIAIIKQMYRIYDYEVQIRKTMNAVLADPLLKIEDQGTLVTRVNRNEISKTYVQIRKDEIQTLKDLVTAYHIKYAGPQAVHGDDTQAGAYDDYINFWPSYVRR